MLPLIDYTSYSPAPSDKISIPSPYGVPCFPGSATPFKNKKVLSSIIFPGILSFVYTPNSCFLKSYILTILKSRMYLRTKSLPLLLFIQEVLGITHVHSSGLDSRTIITTVAIRATVLPHKIQCGGSQKGWINN